MNTNSEPGQCNLDSKEIKAVDQSSHIEAFHQNTGKTPIGLIEQILLKNEIDNSETLNGINSIKSEPNEFDWVEYAVSDKGKMTTGRCAVERELSIKNEGNEIIHPLEAVSFKMKAESSEGDNFDEHRASNQEFMINPSKVKSEIDMDSEAFKISKITEEFTIKGNSETSMDASSDVVNRTSKIKLPRKQAMYEKTDLKSISCFSCSYTTYRKCHLIRHMKLHDRKSAPSSRPSLDIHSCSECYAVFTSEKILDDHVNQKHLSTASSVTITTYNCIKCIYTTTQKSFFDKHISRHRSVVKCIHCNAILSCSLALDDHIVRKHPKCIKSVARLIYECSQCTYKTVKKKRFWCTHVNPF
ncbi:unnamed protein product [Acanthoscelides obtectus]|uniref:C2H2-type domain-containing protein n=1 Tax=Acanthoscelides obtectus TaxID=200917 RepID=A0A9P0KLQ7_ACAOB|nr:unnamed protein product [Acanthoscelides obtectus]CAK1641639.1 Zinc finger protein 335 [Acanthoscelides obtectus]